MSRRTVTVTDELYDYMLDISLRETSVQRRLRERTAELPNAMMQISPDQGQFLAMLVELIEARRTLEVGTFTGYSALTVALSLPADGTIVACDVSEDYTNIAREFWREADVERKIDLRLGPAVDTLDGLLADGEAGTFDFAFIDADKSNYDAYYERALTLVRTGGLILVDNVLWNGSVIDPEKKDADTEAIRALNRKLAGDERVSLSLVPIGDGLTLARKR